jgi:hypothetical protein
MAWQRRRRMESITLLTGHRQLDKNKTHNLNSDNLSKMVTEYRRRWKPKYMERFKTVVKKCHSRTKEMLKRFWKETVVAGIGIKLTNKEDVVANNIFLLELNFLIVSSTLSLGFLFQFLCFFMNLDRVSKFCRHGKSIYFYNSILWLILITYLVHS